MTIKNDRTKGVRFIRTTHFSIALKSRRYLGGDKPGSIVIRLPRGHRLTIRARNVGMETAA